MKRGEALQVLAVIPARGGSKGLPRKNVLPLEGRPLIAHAILAARAAQVVTRLVVSTDDDEIAAAAVVHGAEVVRRPAEISGDTASSELALVHVLESLEQAEGYRPDILVFLQCTSPLTSAGDIDKVVQAMAEEGADTALSVVPFHYFLWRPTEDGAVGVNHDKRVRLMRQQREPEYLETGSIYAMRAAGFLETRHRFFGRTAMVEIPIEHYVEIDDAADFRIAAERMRRLASTAAAALPDPVDALVMDFDGVFTDDRVFVDQEGVESVVCSRRDGMGLERLRKAGVPMMVLSKEANPVVRARCAKLKIPCEHGLETKIERFREWLAAGGHDIARTIYVGNDINDVECLQAAGCAVVPRDAHPSALAVADLVLDADGGRGALRLLSDMILERRR